MKMFMADDPLIHLNRTYRITATINISRISMADKLKKPKISKNIIACKVTHSPAIWQAPGPFPFVYPMSGHIKRCFFLSLTSEKYLFV